MFIELETYAGVAVYNADDIDNFFKSEDVTAVLWKNGETTTVREAYENLRFRLQSVPIEPFNPFVISEAEEPDPMEMVRVHINPEGDGITGLYIDGRLQFGGDEYHDKISIETEAWINGIEWAGVVFTLKDLYLSGEHEQGDITELPVRLDNLPLSDMTEECP